MFKAYTDYPIKELGDIPKERAPIRPINVISYDGNKYCVIYVGGVSVEIKSGYIYSNAGRIGEDGIQITNEEISELPINGHFGE